MSQGGLSSLEPETGKHRRAIGGELVDYNAPAWQWSRKTCPS